MFKWLSTIAILTLVVIGALLAQSADTVAQSPPAASAGPPEHLQPWDRRTDEPDRAAATYQALVCRT
jgi:hypothetical protein